ncbi:MAG: winged helix DNA-binding protein [Alphaproteobacteria bacterium]|nr:winged helix DNA-binding protein [Alphaproteobacteria bacterium]
MSKKEYINLIAENGMIMERMLARINQLPSQSIGYSRQQLGILVGLMASGKSKLKEIAHRNGMPTPNLCIMFRKLESDGLVMRMVDDEDRRNTLYSLTPRGKKIVNQFRDAVMDTIEFFCRNLTVADEKKLTEYLFGINKILKRVEEQNA